MNGEDICFSNFNTWDEDYNLVKDVKLSSRNFVARMSIRSISGIPARDYRTFHISTITVTRRYTVRGDVKAHVKKLVKCYQKFNTSRLAQITQFRKEKNRTTYNFNIRRKKSLSFYINEVESLLNASYCLDAIYLLTHIHFQTFLPYLRYIAILAIIKIPII